MRDDIYYPDSEAHAEFVRMMSREAHSAIAQLHLFLSEGNRAIRLDAAAERFRWCMSTIDNYTDKVEQEMRDAQKANA